MKWTQADIRNEDRLRRLNLINSVTGIKPANLIGTISEAGVPNLAIFSSVFHLGTNPALRQLLGVKLAASEFVGYTQLVTLKDPQIVIYFTYEKSVVMTTFLLCGFANFASDGSQNGVMGILVAKRKKMLAEIGFKAIIGSTCYYQLSATSAGFILR